MDSLNLIRSNVRRPITQFTDPHCCKTLECEIDSVTVVRWDMRFHREHPMMNCCGEIFPSDSPAESFAEWIAQHTLGAVLKTLHIFFKTLQILFDLTSVLLGFVHVQGFDIISRLAGVRLELSDCAFYGR